MNPIEAVVKIAIAALGVLGTLAGIKKIAENKD